MPIKISSIKHSYQIKSPEINNRLEEFEEIGKNSSNEKLFEEMAFCIFTAGASAKMGLNAINSVKDILEHASLNQLRRRLRGVYRFPNSRSRYIIHTRNYLLKNYNMNIREILFSFKDPFDRRIFLAKNKNIMGLGFKESSHFLRNIGFKGYAILDKHMINCMYELKIIGSNKPPASEKSYIAIENKLKQFSLKIGLDFDELDLLLWSEKTGEILK
ncbi:MAG: N-glycosylase/DNA lyase [Thermodesulfobacteriota bacterium]